MKTRLVLVLIIVGLFLAAQTTPVGARSYYCEQFDVQIDIQHDGSIIVTETVIFYFEGGPYTYAFRNLALRELDQVDILSAGMDGQNLPQGDQPGQVDINTDGDPIDITWYFPPTMDESRTFTLSYQVFGIVRQIAGLDGLIWRAVPEEHEYEIRSSTITVNYPVSIEPSGTPALDGAAYQIEQSPGKIVMRAADISKDTALVLDVRFPQGSLIDQPPAWQAKNIERTRQSGLALPYAIGVGGGILLIAFASLGLYRRRNLKAYPSIIPSGIITQPPDDLKPGQIGYLLSNIQANMYHVFATILDLTRRGYLRMHEGEGRGFFKVKDFVISQNLSPQDLQLHEMVIVDFLFKTRKGSRESAKLSEIGAKFGSRISAYSKGLRTEFIAKNLLQTERMAQRSQIGGVGFILFFLGLLFVLGGVFLISITYLQLAFWGTILLGAGLGMTAVGIAMWIQSSSWPVLSDSGAARIKHWSSFRTYLNDLIQSKAVLRDEWLDEYLPYAVAFRLGDRWVKAFKDRGLSTVVPWVISASGGYADGVVLSAAISASSSASSAGGTGGGGGSSGAG